MTLATEGRFREPATPDTTIRLYSWGARVLYLGPALGLTPHRNAVAVVALGLDAPFGVANDPDDPLAGYRQCRSVLIPPNTLHHLAGMAGRMAFLYVDARSRDLPALRSLAGEQTERADFDLRMEADLLECLDHLARGDCDWDQARNALGSILGTSSSRGVDGRVARVLHRLQADPGERVPLTELAADVGLSASRLLHLFKYEVGVPLRRYKLWVAMGAATSAIARGEPLTAAALDAGFASSAHFSAAFREMFGIEPSRLGRGRLVTVADSNGSTLPSGFLVPHRPPSTVMRLRPE